MNTLNTREIEYEILKKVDIDPALLNKVMSAFREVVIESVLDGKEVKIKGIARFYTEVVPDRENWDMYTEKMVTIPSHKVLRVKPICTFKHKVIVNELTQTVPTN